MSTQSLHIAIDVTVTGEQVCGRVRDGVGQPKPFSGWLELIVALDEILAPHPASDAEPIPRAARGLHSRYLTAGGPTQMGSST